MRRAGEAHRPAPARAPAAALAALLLLLPALARAQEETAGLAPEGDFYTAMVKMLAGLALVLGIMVGAYWLVRRLAPKAAALGGGQMRLLARLGLGPRKFLAMVQVADRVLVLGVTTDSIRLVCELDQPLPAREEDQGGGFARVLKRASRRTEEEK